MPRIPVRIVTWEDVVRWSRLLSERIIESGYQPDVIIGIARGGVTPARLLCDYLGVMDLLTIKVEHWVETAAHMEDAIVKYPFTADLRGKKALLVDDICDTGKSIIVSKDYILKNNNPDQLRVATMQYISPVAQIRPDYYVDEVRDWTWYMYPWNYMEDTINLVKKIMQEQPRRNWRLEDIRYEYDKSYGVPPVIPLEDALQEGVRRGLFISVGRKDYRVRERIIL